MFPVINWVYLVSQAEIRVVLQIVGAEMLKRVSCHVELCASRVFHCSDECGLKVVVALISAGLFTGIPQDHPLDVCEGMSGWIDGGQENWKNFRGKRDWLIEKDDSDVVDANVVSLRVVGVGASEIGFNSRVFRSPVRAQTNSPRSETVGINKTLLKKSFN